MVSVELIFFFFLYLFFKYRDDNTIRKQEDNNIQDPVGSEDQGLEEEREGKGGRRLRKERRRVTSNPFVSKGMEGFEDTPVTDRGQS